VDDITLRRELEGLLDVLYEGIKHNGTHLILASLRVVDDLIIRRELGELFGVAVGYTT
jgi:hypothetical protein